MIDSRTVHFDGVGQILFERSKRAKRVIISIKASRGVRVAVPRGVSFKQAREFVSQKKAWIQKHMAEIRQMESQGETTSPAVVDREEAKKWLTGRLHHLAEKHGFTFNKVSIRDQRTRWGSCSHKHNISLNVKLVLLPEELVDYVILHELVHTRVHDHSRRFWTELDRYVGNGKATGARLRSCGRGLLQ